METLTVTEFENRMAEIEQIQKKVDDLLYKGNWLVRSWNFFEGRRLHNLAEEKMFDLFHQAVSDWRENE